jgi:hypothetical protein
MEPSDLRKLIADLTEWRLNKKTKADRLPLSFWERALALDKKYPKLSVREKCKLNSFQWKRRKDKKSPISLPPQFLELSEKSPVPTQQHQAPQVTLELKLPSGITVRFF